MCKTAGTAVIAATARMENYPHFMRKLGRQQTENECGCSKGEKERARESTSKQKRQRSPSCRGQSRLQTQIVQIGNMSSIIQWLIGLPLLRWAL